MTQRIHILCLLFGLAPSAVFAQPASTEKPRASLVIVTEEEAVEATPTPAGEERKAIGDRIRDNSGPVRECYEKRLHDRPTLQGKLVARFDIGPDGRVIGASVEGIPDRELVTCVMAAVRNLEFDKPRGGGKLRVAYPFKFEPRSAK